jgi:hypothetical protein
MKSRLTFSVFWRILQALSFIRAKPLMWCSRKESPAFRSSSSRSPNREIRHRQEHDHVLIWNGTVHWFKETAAQIQLGRMPTGGRNTSKGRSFSCFTLFSFVWLTCWDCYQDSCRQYNYVKRSSYSFQIVRRFYLFSHFCFLSLLTKHNVCLNNTISLMNYIRLHSISPIMRCYSESSSHKPGHTYFVSAKWTKEQNPKNSSLDTRAYIIVKSSFFRSISDVWNIYLQILGRERGEEKPIR